MITERQIEELSFYFKIDKFTIFREYLQLLFLNYLYREKEAEQIYFKGGTCLHLFYNSPRFSEDLDFSTVLSETKLKKLIQKVKKNFQSEVPEISFSLWHKGKSSLRYKLKYQSKDFKYPQTIRIDFYFERILLEPPLSQLKTKFPIASFSLILHLEKEEILAEKVRAFLWRAKGRDIYDLWHLLNRGVFLEKEVLDKKLKMANLKFKKKDFLEKIKKYPEKKIYLDLAKFLPSHHRKIIPELKEKLINLSKKEFSKSWYQYK